MDGEHRTVNLIAFKLRAEKERQPFDLSGFLHLGKWRDAHLFRLIYRGSSLAGTVIHPPPQTRSRWSRFLSGMSTFSFFFFTPSEGILIKKKGSTQKNLSFDRKPEISSLSAFSKNSGKVSSPSPAAEKVIELWARGEKRQYIGNERRLDVLITIF